MKSRPILFSAPMVRALLAGRKTQTRRVLKPQPINVYERHTSVLTTEDGEIRCPYGVPGDQLWVKEAWATVTPYHKEENGCAKCTPANRRFKATDDLPAGSRWASPLFMRKRCSRITLEITDVRVERLQDISEEDAQAEGAPCMEMPDSPGYSSHTNGFAALWDSIAKSGAKWADNPWVWVIEFRRGNG